MEGRHNEGESISQQKEIQSRGMKKKKRSRLFDMRSPVKLTGKRTISISVLFTCIYFKNQGNKILTTDER